MKEIITNKRNRKRGPYAPRGIKLVQTEVVVSSKNNQKLDAYLKQLLTSGEPMPFITGLSKATGVSTATISRYARNKGFFNYSAMRMDFISNAQTNGVAPVEVDKLVKFLKSHTNFAIVSSKQTRLIGEFMLARFEAMNISAELVPVGQKPDEDKALIIISLAGEQVLANNETLKQPHLLITCLRTNNQNTVSLHHFVFQTQSSLELFRSIRKVNEWIQRAIDVLWLADNKVAATLH